MERDENWDTAAISFISAVIKLKGMGNTLKEIMEYVEIAYNPPDLPLEETKEFFLKFVQNTLDILEEDGCEVPK
jgi:hypothetical protein